MSTLGKIIKKSAKKNAHAMTANLVRQLLERGDLIDEPDEDGPEIEALQDIRRYHERMAG